jgi:hypothetical protein
MPKYKAGILMVAVVCLCAALGYGQDGPSLGDVARQARQKREAAKAAESKDPSKAPKVITNEDMPSHPQADATTSAEPEHEAPPASDVGKRPAEYWKSRILAQKELVQSLQSSIDRLNGSVHFAPGNCVRNCVEWNLHQKQKQQEAARLESQLARARENLDSMQDAARREGYGNSVYDP